MQWDRVPCTVKPWQKDPSPHKTPMHGAHTSICFPKQELTEVPHLFLSHFLPSPAIGHWDSVKAKPPKRVMPRDFVTMGRRAAEEGCTTAREFALYYKYSDIRLKDKQILRYGCKVPPNMTFGRPPR